MRLLVVIHRWLGVAFCLFFTMWFATGIVMHFVPYPELTEAERMSGLGPIWTTLVRHPAAAAVAASGMETAARVRLVSRLGSLVYIVQADARLAAIDALSLKAAPVRAGTLALEIAMDHARRRGFGIADARLVELASYDQWTVPNALDLHRPLYRIALNDRAGTNVYVSSQTGEVVRDTTQHERAWNFAGSVLHWIYPTVLRSNWRAWDVTVWVLALAASITALAGMVLGVARLGFRERRISSPYRGWHAWHHWLGLVSMVFVLSFIVSGWLSMDHGRLFSTGKLMPEEVDALRGQPTWADAPQRPIETAAADPIEIEWFFLGSRLYRRVAYADGPQRVADGEHTTSTFIPAAAVNAAAHRLARDCGPARVVTDDDAYRFKSIVQGAPVYRVVCGDDWFHIDGANGALLEKLDASRRSYRWAYQALHTLDFPSLAARPALREAVIVALCGLGLVFSLTGVVIAWRRITHASG